MKKLFVIFFATTCFTASCKKDLVDVSVKVAKPQMATGDMIYWDDLPDEYKNAVQISPATTVSGRSGGGVLPINPYTRDEVFNPFNLTSGNFSMTLPPDNIKKIANGQGKNGIVSHITIWYTTGSPQSILYVISPMTRECACVLLSALRQVCNC